MWNILRRYLHLYFKLWPWLLAYCVKWTHTTQFTSPISATWQYAGWILHMNLHSYSPSHQRVFCGLVVTNWSAKCECVKFDFPWQTWIFFFLPDSWQDNKTFFEDLVFQQEKIQICTFTFEVNFFGLLCVNGCSYFRPRHRYYLVEKSHICAGSQQIWNDSIKPKTKFKFRSNPRYRLNAYLRQRKLFLSQNRNSGQVV